MHILNDCQNYMCYRNVCPITLSQRWFNVGSAHQAVYQYWTGIRPTSRVNRIIWCRKIYIKCIYSMIVKIICVIGMCVLYLLLHYSYCSFVLQFYSFNFYWCLMPSKLLMEFILKCLFIIYLCIFRSSVNSFHTSPPDVSAHGDSPSKNYKYYSQQTHDRRSMLV